MSGPEARLRAEVRLLDARVQALMGLVEDHLLEHPELYGSPLHVRWRLLDQERP